MGRNILLITTDQQRYDSLGCNGGAVARTPTIDSLAGGGINFRRAYNQNTVCMPARATILTGQYTRTHGVVANGVALPVDAPSVAGYLAERGGYRTALFGKAHFEPGFDLGGRWEENARPLRGDIGPWRGFERSVQAAHIAAVRIPGRDGEAVLRPVQHYGHWLTKHHPEHLESFGGLLSGAPGGDTGAPETKANPIPREWYHTDWVADLTCQYLDSLADDDDWFVWMSFPDPHHPWDPPASELDRVPWRDLDLPAGYPGSGEAVEKVLSTKPPHWLGYYKGTWRNQEGGPATFIPGRLTPDNIREINAKVHVMNELVDEACGRVLDQVAARGWDDDTDVFFTTDHGELQGDFGLLYKGPFHTEALMRLPLVWRPAPSAGLPPAEVEEPVGQLDLAPTFCELAGIPQAWWMEGAALPTTAGSRRERVLCEWDSQFPGYGMHLRSIYRDGYLCTVYEPSTAGRPNGLEKALGDWVLESSGIEYEGTEGELYNVTEDPSQFHNLWDGKSHRGTRDDLVADLYDNLPVGRSEPLPVEAPA
jgi:arylsulfatase A-like enzyme